MNSHPSLKDLEHRWRIAPPPPARAEEVERLLVERYNAYEIPTWVIPDDDYAADPEVFPEDIYKLYTITDPRALAILFNEQEREMFSWATQPQEEPEELEEEELEARLDEVEQLENAWRWLFEDPAWVGFNLIHLQQGRGERITILLEGHDGLVDGYRIYNACEQLNRVLMAHIGFNKLARPDTPEDQRVDVGNIEDYDFAKYLRAAYLEGLLPG